MKSGSFWAAVLCVLVSGASLRASSFYGPCVPGTVASYQALNGGCTIGILVFSDFTFANTGNASDLNDNTGITLSPTNDGFSFTQTTSGIPVPLQVGINESAIYDVGWHFFVDPGPRATASSLDMDPPFGDATVTQYYCNESRLFQDGASAIPFCNGGNASSAPESLRVHFPSPLTASLVFRSPAAFGNVLTQIVLNGGATGAGFDSSTGGLTVVDTSAPEPGGVLTGFLGLAMLVWLRRSRSA